MTKRTFAPHILLSSFLVAGVGFLPAHATATMKGGLQGWEKGFAPMEKNIEQGKKQGSELEQKWYEWQVKKSIYEEKMTALTAKMKKTKESLKAQADKITQMIQAKQNATNEMRQFTTEMTKATKELSAESQSLMEFTYFAVDKAPPMPYQTPNHEQTFNGWIDAYKRAHPFVTKQF
ncbi:MAG: hypothetical protein ACK5O7_02810 [Holosporales bacterium]